MMLDIWEGLQVAWNGILANRLRSGLTMLGVLIGVATVIALLSIGEGANASISQRLSGAGTNLLIVSPGSTRGFGGIQAFGGGAQALTMADAEAIADLSRITEAERVVPDFSQRAQLVAGENNVNASIKGTVAEHLPAFGLELAEGRFLDETDVAGRRNVAVLGSQLAVDLFGGQSAVGQRIKIDLPGQGSATARLSVIGVLASQERSALTGNPDDTLYAPITTAQYELFDGRNVYGQATVSSVSVLARDGRSEQAIAQIDTLMRERHGLLPEDEADFSVTSQEDLLDLASEISGTMTLFLGVIALISLIVGGIGIMNIMLVSVTERTREIGIRKAVGARTSDILLQFLLEAIALSAMGGILGVLVGAAVAWGMTELELMPVRVVPSAVVLALSFSLLVGLLAGVYPARRAAGLRPIEALRYE